MAYVRSDRRELWIANRDGADARRVTAAGEGVAAPRWLPDTRHLLFVRDGRVWLLDATHAARAQALTLRPIEMKQVEIYRAKTLRTELQFDSAGVTKFRESKPDDKTPPKRKRFEFLRPPRRNPPGWSCPWRAGLEGSVVWDK